MTRHAPRHLKPPSVRHVATATAVITVGAFTLGSAIALPPAQASVSSSTAASNGQLVTTTLDAPTSGLRTVASTLPVSGTSSLSAFAPTPQSVVYVIDVSGSTFSPNSRDCNGDGIFTTAGDDINGDVGQPQFTGQSGDTLDCEIAATIALNHSFPAARDINIGVQALGGEVPGYTLGPVATADMTPGGSDIPFTGYQSGTNPEDDLKSVARSLRRGQIGLYTVKALQTNTNYEASLQRLASTMSLPTEAGRKKIAYFTSDGLPTVGAGANGQTYQLQPAVQSVVASGTVVNTYGVGNAAGSCAPANGSTPPAPLRYIADQTGGTCTIVTNPTQLAAAVTAPITLAHVEVSDVQGAVTTGPFTVPIAADGSWSLGGLSIPRGTSQVLATTVASDGTRATAQASVYGTTAPSVTTGGDVVAEGNDVALSSSVIDPDGGPYSYSWSPSAGLNDPTAAHPTFHAVQDGNYPFTLTVTDPDGLTGSGTGSVHVVNVAPVIDSASLSPSPVGTNEDATLSVAFHDAGVADGHSASVDWGDASAGPQPVTESGGSGTVTAHHTYTHSGTFTITVTISDGTDSSMTQIQNVAVDARPVAQDSTGGSGFLTDEGTPVTLHVSASDADGDPLTYSWSPSSGLDNPLSATPVFDARQDGDYPFTVTVSDGKLSSSVTEHVIVRNLAPIVTSATLPATARTGDTVNLQAAFTDAGVIDTHGYDIAWGDGTHSSSSTPVEPAGATPGSVQAAHVYGHGGTYTVLVSVIDERGAVGTRSLTITVDTPPTVDAGPDSSVGEGGGVTLHANGLDADGDALGYSWSPATKLSNPSSATPTFTGVDDAVDTYTVTVTDPSGATATDTVTVTTTNVVPSVATPAFTGQPLPGQSVTATSTFTDPGVIDTHTASIDWGDGTSSPATVDDSAHSASGTHIYSGAGSYVVVVTVTDNNGGIGMSARGQGATISIDRAPTANAGGPYSVPEGSSVTLAGTASDPDGDALTYAWSPATRLTGATTLTPSYSGLDDGSQNLTLTATDPFGLTGSSTAAVTTVNVAPTVTAFTGPIDPQPLGTTVTLNGAFTDPGTADTHTASISWGDGLTSSATIGSGRTFSASHSYTASSVYNPVVTVTDDDGGIGTATLQQPVVSYDPNGSFVTGGGTIVPAEGGKANLGFNAKYKSGTSTPTGATEYQSKARSLNLHSTSYDWLVVNGAMARWHGHGTVNGTGSYTFEVTVLDGQSSGGGGTDKVRVHIWDSVGVTSYDTQPGAADGAQPTTTLSGGQIKMH